MPAISMQLAADLAGLTPIDLIDSPVAQVDSPLFPPPCTRCVCTFDTGVVEG